MPSADTRPLEGMLSLTPQIAKLCSPLFESSPIVSYVYYEMHATGNIYRLSTHEKYNERIVADFLSASATEYPQSLIEVVMNDHRHCGFSLDDLSGNTVEAVDRAYSAFSLGHACMFTETATYSVVKCHTFFGTFDDNTINDFYLNNTTLLTYFSRYISKHMSASFKRIEPFSAPEKCVTPLRNWMQNLCSLRIEIPQFLTSYGFQSELSKRQREIIYWYLMGKTTDETSAILGLSNNTIISYFNRLKKKFGCKSKAQILSELLKDGICFPDLSARDRFI